MTDDTTTAEIPVKVHLHVPVTVNSPAPLLMSWCFLPQAAWVELLVYIAKGDRLKPVYKLGEKRFVVFDKTVRFIQISGRHWDVWG